MSKRNRGDKQHTLALADGLDGRLVAEGDLARLHHERKAGVDVLSDDLLRLLGGSGGRHSDSVLHEIWVSANPRPPPILAIHHPILLPKLTIQLPFPRVPLPPQLLAAAAPLLGPTEPWPERRWTDNVP